MSSRKRAYAELVQSSSQPSIHRTPSRNAPSTPHTIRALQQRSATRQRSAKSRKTLFESLLPRPDSARGTLRRLAQLTAPATKKRIVTPIGKENVLPDAEEGEDDEASVGRKPGLSLPIEDTLEDGDDDSELPMAPTPSVLPDDDENDPTMTFKAIDFARGADGDKRAASERPNRRKSRISSYTVDDDDDRSENDETMDITAEIGRRAVSEGPFTERLHQRGSFGSIRMSDFGTELERRRTSDFQILRNNGESRIDVREGSATYDEELEKDLDAETENLRALQHSALKFDENDLSMQIPAIGEEEDTFRLDLPDDTQTQAIQNGAMQGQPFRGGGDYSDTGHFGSRNEDIDGQDSPHRPSESNSPLFMPEDPITAPKQTALQATTAARVGKIADQPVRLKGRNLKMTRHGHVVPSLPSSLVKHVATRTQTLHGKRPPKLGREHMRALDQATEWFFEQVGEDLEAYSNHARRKKKVVDQDVLLLMKRQKAFREDGKLENMAKQWLTPAVRAELDLPATL